MSSYIEIGIYKIYWEVYAFTAAAVIAITGIVLLIYCIILRTYRSQIKNRKFEKALKTSKLLRRAILSPSEISVAVLRYLTGDKSGCFETMEALTKNTNMSA